MTNSVTIITPPDKLFDNVLSILVINPTDELTHQLDGYLKKLSCPANLYIYDFIAHDIEWLLSAIDRVTYAIIDIDAINPTLRDYVSYIISKPSVWYKVSNLQTRWDLLSPRRYFDFPEIR